MWHCRKKRRPGGGFSNAMIARLAGFLACLAITADPAFAQAENPLLPRNLSPWGMFLNADIVVKAVMIGLAFASLATWTVWLAKTIELRVAKRVARRRLKMLERGGDLMAASRSSCCPPHARPSCPTASSTTASRSALPCGWSVSKRR
jgi:biopolymer transport protein ExbB